MADSALDTSMSPDALMLLDDDRMIRDVNPAFERLAMRGRDDMLGGYLFDVFPDNPDDTEANGSRRLDASLESAAVSGGTHTMAIVRFDVANPADDGAYTPKLWTCSNTAVRDDTKHVGLLQRVSPILSLNTALTALRGALSGGDLLGHAEQLHILDALATNVRNDRKRVAALAKEVETLERALESRDIIGQAKGKLMERYDIDADAAFAMLTRLSQTSNTKLEQIAQKLVELGSLS